MPKLRSKRIECTLPYPRQNEPTTAPIRQSTQSSPTVQSIHPTTSAECFTFINWRRTIRDQYMVLVGSNVVSPGCPKQCISCRLLYSNALATHTSDTSSSRCSTKCDPNFDGSKRSRPKTLSPGGIGQIGQCWIVLVQGGGIGHESSGSFVNNHFAASAIGLNIK